MLFKKIMPLIYIAGLALAAVAVIESREVSKRLDRIESRLGGREQIECNPSDSAARARQSVVRIIGGESEGTGFAIREGGFILTNYHVIEFEPEPKVVASNGLIFTGKIVLTNSRADLAVIKIDHDLPVIRLKSAKWLRPAEEILSIGYPLGGSIAGEASVTKGLFSGLRQGDEDGVTYVQTDANMMPGVSGGPMIDVCGDAVGVNTAGIFGLNLGIDADTVRRKILASASGADPAPDVQEMDFNPGLNPYESVRAFYNYLKARRLDKAFELLSENFTLGYSFEHWAAGYSQLLDTTIVDLAPDLEVDHRIRVKLSTKDFINEGVVSRFFEGYWDTREVNGQWLLWDPEIREVHQPDPEWFRTTSEKLDEIRADLEAARSSGRTEPADTDRAPAEPVQPAVPAGSDHGPTGLASPITAKSVRSSARGL